MNRIIVFTPDYNKKHVAVLRAMAEGIPGALLRPVLEYEPCDIAVIFGGVKKAYPPTWSKRRITDNHSGRSLLMVESAFINRGVYYQVGWGGTAGHADFNTSKPMPVDRISKIAGSILPWRVRPDGPVVVCGQLPRDVQVQDTNHCEWVAATVDYYATRGFDVWFRPHPKIGGFDEYGVDRRFFKTGALGDMLAVARAFVTWNSTTGVDAVMAGVPTVAMDSGSMAYPVAAHDLEHLDYTPNRHEWAAALGYSQWTLDEMRAGAPWKHLNAEY